jgi:hypothetical protein
MGAVEKETRGSERGTRFGPAGYISSLIGAVGGGFGGGAAGLAAGFWYLDVFMPSAELEGLLPVGIGLVTGAAAGAGLGSWAGVAIVRHSGPALTGALTAVMVAPIPVVLYRFVDTLESPRWLLPAIWLGAIAVLAVLARGVASGLARAGIRTGRIGPAVLWLVAAAELLVVAGTLF